MAPFEKSGENPLLNPVRVPEPLSALSERHTPPPSSLAPRSGEIVLHSVPSSQSDLKIDAIAATLRSMKAAESAGLAGDRRCRELLESLPVAVYTTDAQGFVDLFNTAAVELWGRAPTPGVDRWCGSGKMRRMDGTNLSLEECPMATAIKSGKALRAQQAIVERPNGELRYVLANPRPLLDDDGVVTGAINALIDVTDRHELDQLQSCLAAIVESSDDAIVSKDLNGTIRSWNAAAERLFGYTAEEAIGRSITMLIPEGRPDEEPAILSRIRRGERVNHYETTRRRKDGSFIEVSLTVSPIRDGTGRVVGASKIARDITDRKRAERAMAEAHESVVAASRAKDDFLAALSHELRTPLNPALLIASNAAEDPAISETLRADFASIRKNIELEARLIDDLLDLTRITRGKLWLNFSPQNIHNILNDAIATVDAELREKQIDLVTHYSPIGAFVRGDAIRLQQVFWNILKNAVKFTAPCGQVSVSTEGSTTGDRIVVKIADSGIGMTGTELGQIFNAFTQGEHAGSHRFGGLGLGLTISKKLVELHQGSIQAKSDGRNQGSVFTIELPLLPSEAHLGRDSRANGPRAIDTAQGDQAADSGAAKRPNILLVEDHEPTRTALTSLLTRRGFHVVVAATVHEARRLAANAPIDLVISDIGLPDGNGYELMAELASSRQMPGVALTGYGGDYDIARSRAVGFSRHLTKPVTIQALDEALAAIQQKSN